MRGTIALIAMALLVMSVIPMVVAISTGGGIGVDIGTTQFEPKVWMCDNRVVLDDGGESGRISGEGDKLVERINNYAFEGEQVHWSVLVMDKNGINKVSDVYSSVNGEMRSNCQLVEILDNPEEIRDSCNARIGQADLEDIFHENTAAYYDCTYTVAGDDYGDAMITVEAIDFDGLVGTMAEKEFWFFNPIIALNIDGDLSFDDVEPGTDAYSDTITVGNDADAGSGVLLDMFISGTDFTTTSPGAQCPTSNKLDLDAFRYFATSGAYSTAQDDEDDNGDFVTVRDKDAEGYVNIQETMEGFSTKMYREAEIIQAPNIVGPYYPGNVLAPGAEMSLTFKLSLPEPCNGDFSSTDGAIQFWGEAI